MNNSSLLFINKIIEMGVAKQKKEEEEEGIGKLT